MCIMLGIGESGLLQAICEDPVLRHKDIHVCAFPGDVIPDASTLPQNTRIDRITSHEDVQAWVHTYFSDHHDIVRLGGCDIIDDHPLCAEAEQAREQLKPRLFAMLQDRPWGLGNDINDTFMGLWHAAQNAKTLLPMPSIGQLAASLGTTPTISIGAGPSLGSHLDELRALQDKCLLVCCDAAYPGLVKEGIIPHLVTPLERLQQQAPLVASAQGTRTVFAGLPVCHPDTLKPFDGRAIYFHALDKCYDWFAPNETLRCLAGSSTGVLSFYVAASLTRGPVYLVGHDLATGAGASHWGGAALAGSAFQTETKNAGGFGANGYEKRLIPGNSGELVESIMWWDQFRCEISNQAKLIPGRVFNVNAHTRRGAVIEYTSAAPLPAPDDLPAFAGLDVRADNADRLANWQTRANQLPADTAGFIAAMEALRVDLRAMRRRPPHEWDLNALMARCAPDAGVSEGNRACFQYVLRSALFNEQTAMSFRARRFRSRTEAHWQTMDSLDALADAMTIAMKQLKPLLDSLAC
jgi:hypothetical protein